MMPLRSPVYLYISFFLLALFLITMTLLELKHIEQTEGNTARLLLLHHDKMQRVHQMRLTVRERMVALNAMVLTDDPFVAEERYEQFLAAGDRYIALRRQLEATPLDAEEHNLHEALRQLTIEGTRSVEQVVALVRNDRGEEARPLLLGPVMAFQEEMVTKSDELLQYYLDAVSQLVSSAQQKDSRWRQVVMVVGLFLVLGLLQIARYVIGRIRTEQEALQRAHERLETAVDERTRELQQSTVLLNEAQRVARLGHWEWDIATGELRWSDEIYRIFGVSPGEYAPSYELFLQSVHPDDRVAVTSAVEQAVAGTAEYSIEHRVVWPDGTLHTVHERGEVRRAADGSPLSMLGTVQDISEQKVLERRLRLSASVFHSTGDGVMITNSENHIIEINEAFSQILGYLPEEVVGKNPRMLQSGRHDEAFFQAFWHSLNETGQWQGEIWDRRSSGEVLPLWMTVNAVHDEKGELTNYVALFRDITKHKETESNLWQIAHHDPLTSLPNRSLMYARLQLAMSQADREEEGVALLLIDLDGFKQVNDSLGHSAGDALLVKVAEILRAQVRETDTVARYAGDEFVVLLKGLQDRQAIERIAASLIEVLSRPFTLEEGEAQIGASIGVALYPTHAYDAKTLMAKADQAMYQAKRAGKGQVRFFAS